MTTVFASPDSPRKFTIQIVSNKYNPGNFWLAAICACVSAYSLHFGRSGRWRSEYIIDFNEGEVTGLIRVNVHYYENGNVCLYRCLYAKFTHVLTLLKVQLSTTHTPTINFPPNPSLPPATTASKLLASIEEQETSYQVSLNETYHDLGEKTFKGLRRALPMTRQKLDWERVSN